MTEANIRADQKDESVLNDVAIKTNAVIDSASALDQDSRQKDVISWELGNNGIKIGFGHNLEMPMDALVNNSLRANNMSQASQASKDYIIGVLSLRESAMGLQKVLTGSARNNEAQIEALQATLPGYEDSSDTALQRVDSFTQNLDALRQPIARIPGSKRVAVKPRTKAPHGAGGSY